MGWYTCGMRVLIVGLTLALLSLPLVATAQPAPPDTGPAAPPGEVGEAPAPESADVTFERLKLQLRSEDATARIQATLDLGLLGDPRGEPLLIKTLAADTASEVRMAAAQALAPVRTAGSKLALQAAAKEDSAPGVREAALAALAAQTPNQSPPIPADMAQPPPIPEEDRRPAAAPHAPRSPAYNPVDHPEYASTRRLRTAGILVTAIGGGVGLIAGVLGGMATGICSAIAADSWDGSTDCTAPAGVAITGGATFAISLAVGLPMLVSGQRKLNVIQRGEAGLVPQVQVVASDKHRILSARWAF